ncbi:MAG: septum formation protein Maf [Candidatus Marinimicrobia bacterium]|nr:septum formation protein Maf [Candidatus Neomarinimicrobiota bacterium]
MIRQTDAPVILASASPRRKELLEQLGLRFDCLPARLDETLLAGESPLDHVQRLAEEKGRRIASAHPQAIVISADTIVLMRDQILGKPADTNEAFRMLKMLSGAFHKVITAFAVTAVEKNIRIVRHVTTDVLFRDLSDEEIWEYIGTGSPMDKAGAYGIQDIRANLVRRIDGCFYNVIGFPVAEFSETWNELFPA